MYVMGLLLLLAYFMIISFLDAGKTKALLNQTVTETIRCNYYKFMIAGEWMAVIPVVIICLYAPISAADMGLSGLHPNDTVWFTVATFVVCGIFFIIGVLQILLFTVSEKHRKAARVKLNEAAKTTHHHSVMHLVLPRSKKEKSWFFGLSLTAGIVEEFLCRGFLYFLLQAVFPGIPILITILSASILFGLVHHYQGVSGMMKTTVTGALLGCLYVASGSLIPGMLLHFFMDASNGILLSEE